MTIAIHKRLAVAERQLAERNGPARELIIIGGLVPGVAPLARIDDGAAIHQQEGEDFEAFQQRVRAMAESSGWRWIFYGGFPDNPVEWVVPLWMEEALAAARWKDELDADP
jgi:hypothetical protein